MPSGLSDDEPQAEARCQFQEAREWHSRLTFFEKSLRPPSGISKRAGRLAIDPRSMRAQEIRAKILAGSGDQAAAIEVLKAALVTDPAQASLNLELGALLQSQGLLERALVAQRRRSVSIPMPRVPK
jgi:hypothetical protein